jgi:hypothetical protein
MAAYRALWWWVVTVGGTVGLLAAIALRPHDQALALALTGFSLGCCAGCLYDLRNEPFTLRPMLLFGTASGLFLVSLLGLVAVLGRLAGFLLTALLVVGSPWCLATGRRLVARRLGRDPAWPHPAPDTQ